MITCPTASVPLTPSTTNVVAPDNAPLTVATAPAVPFSMIASPNEGEAAVPAS